MPGFLRPNSFKNRSFRVGGSSGLFAGLSWGFPFFDSFLPVFAHIQCAIIANTGGEISYVHRGSCKVLSYCEFAFDVQWMARPFLDCSILQIKLII